MWDHLQYGDRVTEIADVWTCCAAVAMRTERMVFGPMVTPLARRRPQVLARQAASLAVLSGERFVLGLGLGDDWVGEFSDYGDEADPKVRGRLLDEGLEALTGLPRRRLPACAAGADLAGRPVPQQGARCGGPPATTASSSSASTGPTTWTPWSRRLADARPGGGLRRRGRPAAGPGRRAVARPRRLVGADPDRALRPRPRRGQADRGRAGREAAYDPRDDGGHEPDGEPGEERRGRCAARAARARGRLTSGVTTWRRSAAAAGQLEAADAVGLHAGHRMRVRGSEPSSGTRGQGVGRPSRSRGRPPRRPAAPAPRRSPFQPSTRPGPESRRSNGAGTVPAGSGRVDERRGPSGCRGRPAPARARARARRW